MEASAPIDPVYDPLFGKRFPSAGTLLFGRYQVVRELGRGGMGLVLLARDLELDTDVAIKLVPDLIVQDREGLEELKHEVLRGMALTHPNIVRTHGFERDAELAAIIMEFVDGGNFIELKHAHFGGCLDADKLLPWLEQLCPVLDYAHFDIRIGHRDLKPHNLMFTSHGRLKVADFGISSTLNETGTRVTMRDHSSGTPAYMSPQQIMGERTSHLDDVYSLGATIYELLTGKPPFYRGRVLAQVLECVPESMGVRREELEVFGKDPIPQVWEDTVAACLSKESASRPQSAGEVLARLTGIYQPEIVAAAEAEPLLQPAAVVTTMATKRRRVSQRKGAWLPLLIVVIALAGISFAYLQSQRSTKNTQLEKLTVPVVPAPPDITENDPKPKPVPPRITSPDVLPDAQVGDLYHFSLGADGGSPPYVWTSDGTILPNGLNLNEAGLLSGTPLSASRSGFSLKVTDSDGQTGSKSVALVILEKPAPVVVEAEPEIEPEPELVVPLPSADRKRPYQNSLGMEFVPAGTPDVLVSIWLTRIEDFEAFVNETKYDATANVSWLETGGPARFSTKPGHSWKDPGFPQEKNAPVCGVSWNDATAFCKWLTTWERGTGNLSEAFEYRLPTVAEWVAACGSHETSGKLAKYPWGRSETPPEGHGNLAGLELNDSGETPVAWKKISLYDNAARTSRVDRFPANDAYGIYDYYGNLWQFCQDLSDPKQDRHLMMGGSWATGEMKEIALAPPANKDRLAHVRTVDAGFRCVLARVP